MERLLNEMKAATKPPAPWVGIGMVASWIPWLEAEYNALQKMVRDQADVIKNLEVRNNRQKDIIHSLTQPKGSRREFGENMYD